MKPRARVIVTFAKDDDLEPSVGNVIEQLGTDKGLLFKVRQDDGVDNWYPDSWVSPLLKSVN